MNMIRSAKNQIAELTAAAYRAAVQEGLLPEGITTVPAVEIPKDTANGDYTTTFCLAASKAMRKNPREVAKILTEHMDELHKVAAVLMEREKISGEEFDTLMKGGTLPPFAIGEQTPAAPQPPVSSEPASPAAEPVLPEQPETQDPQD